MNLKLDAYLRRIGYTGPLSADLATLTAVHRQHVRTIPYENLDVQLAREVTLDIERVYTKIVTHKRGGWCYEMNGLLAWALHEIGFKFTELAAGAMREERGDEAFGNHRALLVHLERDYLADVGFGDGLLEPIALTAAEFVQGSLRFRLEQLDNDLWRFVNHPEGGAKSFDFYSRPADFSLLNATCTLLQTAPDSPFVLNAVCQIHTMDGLMMLRGRSLKSVSHAGVSHRTIADVADYRATLAKVFGLEIPETDYLWQRILERDRQREAAS
ncbi:MAG: arylamine N-acetyltransferase family protein [Steroidobacter sp.]